MDGACNSCREQAHFSSMDLGNNKDRDINGFFVYQWQPMTCLKRDDLQASHVVHSPVILPLLLNED